MAGRIVPRRRRLRSKKGGSTIGPRGTAGGDHKPKRRQTGGGPPGSRARGSQERAEQPAARRAGRTRNAGGGARPTQGGAQQDYPPQRRHPEGADVGRRNSEGQRAKPGPKRQAPPPHQNATESTPSAAAGTAPGAGGGGRGRGVPRARPQSHGAGRRKPFFSLFLLTYGDTRRILLPRRWFIMVEKSIRIHVRLTTEMHEMLKTRAFLAGTTVSDVARRCIADGLGTIDTWQKHQGFRSDLNQDKKES